MTMLRHLKHVKVAVMLTAAFMAAWLALANSENPLRYRTDAVSRGDIAETVTANGTLNPIQIANVGTQVSGKVSKLYVSVNSHVKTGDMLAEIDPSLTEAQLRQSRSGMETARTAFEQAERDLSRTRTLVARDYVARVDLERAQQTYLSARNNYDSARSQVERDEVNLSYTKILSPIDGVVISQDVTLGQTVAASFQTPNLFKIAGDLTQMKIDVNLPESDIGRVKKDMAATFAVDAFPDREFKGAVSAINMNPNSQQGVVTYTVSVAVDNADRALMPGMTAYVSIRISERKDVLRVPVAALRFVPQQTEKPSALRRLFQPSMRPPRMPAQGTGVTPQAGVAQTVYKLENGEIQPVEITTGVSDDHFIEISGDSIAEGDVVATGMLPPGRP